MNVTDNGKTLYFIAGPNGAGKTTASMKILPTILDCEEFVNADEIARGLSPFHPESVAIEAGRLQLERIGLLLSKGVNFSIETTLATKSYVFLIRKAKEQGYTVKLLFFWLPSAEMAIERVKRRVLEGGHNIPEDVIRRRYKAGIRNLFDIYIPIVNSWQLHSNADSEIQMIAFCENGEEIIIDKDKFKRIMPDKYKDTQAYQIFNGINAAYKQMVEEKMLLGREIVTADNDGNIRIESARDCYKRLYQ